MKKLTKKRKDILNNFDIEKIYALDDAIDIIKNNSLTDFDKSNLLPTKLKQGVAL